MILGQNDLALHLHCGGQLTTSDAEVHWQNTKFLTKENTTRRQDDNENTEYQSIKCLCLISFCNCCTQQALSKKALSTKKHTFLCYVSSNCGLGAITIVNHKTQEKQLFNTYSYIFTPKASKAHTNTTSFCPTRTFAVHAISIHPQTGMK